MEKALALRALKVLGGAMSPDMRAQHETIIASIEGLTKTPLEQLEKALDVELQFFATLLRPRKPLQAYIGLFEELSAGEPPVWLTKHFIESEVFAGFDHVWSRWALFPPHTRMGFDINSEDPRGGGHGEWRLLEAALFEDLAMLWNEAHSSPKESQEQGPMHYAERIPLKRFMVFKRSTARAAFALLEAYVNGIAADIELTEDVAAMPALHREMLREQSDDGHARFKPLREKILQYPKIALGVTHPPIQGSQSAAFKLILKRERDWRDAVMHPTPKFDEERDASREFTFYNIELADLQELVDSVVALIKQIDTAMDGKFGRASVWIQERGSDGLFPETVFY